MITQTIMRELGAYMVREHEDSARQQLRSSGFRCNGLLHLIQDLLACICELAGEGFICLEKQIGLVPLSIGDAPLPLRAQLQATQLVVSVALGSKIGHALQGKPFESLRQDSQQSFVLTIRSRVLPARLGVFFVSFFWC